ncbi:UDP-glucuronosyl/UDP-glucosyltransferase [Corchorus olitorius]|uniref:UDP-glucuronosyl/UDP-glucosyltransferase n=1 Tax=Corchorus olitorius TaxID=93759 RepID=A0A1R3GZE9_9ROSI|nr:UDP-glucuronosyl/UDP-glucosyltransferase [Corchorus olitorius]
MPTTQSSKEHHVAVLAFPFGSHDLTILGLTRRLARALPKVQFSFLSTAKSNDSMFSAFKPEDIPSNVKPYDVEDGVPMDHVFSENPLEILELFLKAAHGNFKKGLDVAEIESGKKVTCLIADMFLTFVADMAKGMEASWIPLCVAVPYVLSAHVYTDLIRRLYNNDGAKFEPQTLDFIPGLNGFRFSDLSEEILPRESGETFFSYELSKIGCLLPQATAIVMNFCQELYSAPLLEDLKFVFPNLLNVGFLTQELPPPELPPSDSDQTGCLLWLDKQEPKSVAYIGFGTVASPEGNELTAIAEALEESKIPFIWSLNENCKRHLPNGFIQRTKNYGKIVSWAPQSQILGHVSIGVFVTHCGANSVFESVANEVPMICRPMFGDHGVNGRLVEEIWGIGVKVEGIVFNKSGLLKSLKLVLGQENGREMRQRSRALRELVLKAAEPSGSASQDFKTLLYDELGDEIISILFIARLASIQAIEANSNVDTEKIVTYWVLFSLISLFESTFMGLLQWLPFWPYMKLTIICWLMIPGFDGAFYVYNHFVHPCLYMDVQTIINWFKKQREFLLEDNFLANGSEALHKLIANESKGREPSMLQKDIKPVQVMEEKEIAAVNSIPETEPNACETQANMLAVACPESKVTTCWELSEIPSDQKQVQKEWTCALCLVTTTCEHDLKMHLRGLRHRAAFVEKMKANNSKKEAEKRAGTSQQIRMNHARNYMNSQFRCSICNIFCCRSEDLDGHLRGKKHLARIEELNNSLVGGKLIA